jgi:hypothetical protein
VDKRWAKGYGQLCRRKKVNLWLDWVDIKLIDDDKNPSPHVQAERSTRKMLSGNNKVE